MVVPLYLAIDQGSHASRALVIDATGGILAAARAGIAVGHPRPGWVEHDPDEVVRSVRLAARRAWHRAGRPPLKGAALATQRSTIVCWDRVTGRPLSRALSWQDTRHAAFVARLEPHGPAVRRHTGLRLSPHYGASKLRWCLDHLRSVRDAAGRDRLAWGPLSSFLLHRLLEERPLVVDPANASRTLLWDIDTGEWSGRLLGIFGLPRAPLPACVATRHHFGHMRIGARAVPLGLCTGDQSAVPFSRGRPDPRTIFVNLGTGGFVQRVVPSRPAASGRLLTGVIRAGPGGTDYALEGTVNGAGAALDRYAGRLGLDVSKVLGEGSLDEAEVPLFLNGVSGLGSPFWRPRFASRFVGRGTPRRKLQAVLESVLFLVRINIDRMVAVSGDVDRIVLTGGLAASDGLCGRLAEVCDLTVSRPESAEATSLGSVYLLRDEKVRWSATPCAEFRPAGSSGLARRFAAWRKEMNSALKAR